VRRARSCVCLACPARDVVRAAPDEIKDSGCLSTLKSAKLGSDASSPGFNPLQLLWLLLLYFQLSSPCAFAFLAPADF
jgi:hypothetical protein